uniref:Short-chain alcohol dehydrogenase n=1 Tax=uncultured organism TaxID=155900 RepID=A0A090A1B6_9ZZZZ|nr:short-chain alcohol dehydrogenase [uncultured organism]
MAQYDVADRSAIVTGGASGIGAAVVEKFAGNGAKVVVADFDEVGGRAMVDKLTADGKTASFFKVDVAEPDQVEAMVRHAVDTYGGLHIAVNNAGIGGASAPTGEYGIDDWKQVIDINLNGVFYGLRYEIPAMLESGGGAIVNVASILGSVGFANAPAYVAAKHGVVGLTKNAAIEYATQNIRVVSVGPGFIKTPLLDKNLDEETMKVIAGMHPVQRMGTPDEVANLITYLVSDEASFLTGGYYLVDGGYTAQ